MARFILDIEINSPEEFVAVMQELKTILPERKASLAIIGNGNHFNEDRKLNALTDGEISAFNNGICGCES